MQQTVPASIQLLLLADRIVPADTMFSAGTTISYSQKKVKTNELAVFLLAYTLWDLSRKNYISIDEKVMKKLLFIPTRKLLVGRQKDIPVSGDLENLLLRGITHAAIDVEKLIYRLWDQNQPWPHKTIINIACNEACDLRLGTITNRAETRKLLKGFSGETDFVADPSAVAKIEAEFELSLMQWKQFSVSSAGIASMLLSACRAGLNSRVIQND